MKIVFNALELTGDRPEEEPDEYRLNGRKLVQESQAIDASQVKLFSRGNHRFEHSFTVQRVHEGGAAAAELYLAQHQEACLLETGTLTLTYRNPATGAIVATSTWAVAQISQISGTSSGASTIINYSITTGAPAFPQ